MTGLEILRVERLPAEPWKNKGGITRTIAAAPPDAGIDTADWRVALSDIERPGPFSHLPGIDRLLLIGAMQQAAGRQLVSTGNARDGGFCFLSGVGAFGNFDFCGRRKFCFRASY